MDKICKIKKKEYDIDEDAFTFDCAKQSSENSVNISSSSSPLNQDVKPVLTRSMAIRNRLTMVMGRDDSVSNSNNFSILYSQEVSSSPSITFKDKYDRELSYLLVLMYYLHVLLPRNVVMEDVREMMVCLDNQFNKDSSFDDLQYSEDEGLSGSDSELSCGSLSSAPCSTLGCLLDESKAWVPLFKSWDVKWSAPFKDPYKPNLTPMESLQDFDFRASQSQTTEINRQIVYFADAALFRAENKSLLVQKHVGGERGDAVQYKGELYRKIYVRLETNSDGISTISPTSDELRENCINMRPVFGKQMIFRILTIFDLFSKLLRRIGINRLEDQDTFSQELNGGPASLPSRCVILPDVINNACVIVENSDAIRSAMENRGVGMDHGENTIKGTALFLSVFARSKRNLNVGMVAAANVLKMMLKLPIAELHQIMFEPVEIKNAHSAEGISEKHIEDPLSAAERITKQLVFVFGDGTSSNSWTFPNSGTGAGVNDQKNYPLLLNQIAALNSESEYPRLYFANIIGKSRTELSLELKRDKNSKITLLKFSGSLYEIAALPLMIRDWLLPILVTPCDDTSYCEFQAGWYQCLWERLAEQLLGFERNGISGKDLCTVFSGAEKEEKCIVVEGLSRTLFSLIGVIGVYSAPVQHVLSAQVANDCFRNGKWINNLIFNNCELPQNVVNYLMQETNIVFVFNQLWSLLVDCVLFIFDVSEGNIEGLVLEASAEDIGACSRPGVSTSSSPSTHRNKSPQVSLMDKNNTFCSLIHNQRIVLLAAATLALGNQSTLEFSSAVNRSQRLCISLLSKLLSLSCEGSCESEELCATQFDSPPITQMTPSTPTILRAVSRIADSIVMEIKENPELLDPFIDIICVPPHHAETNKKYLALSKDVAELLVNMINCPSGAVIAEYFLVTPCVHSSPRIHTGYPACIRTRFVKALQNSDNVGPLIDVASALLPVNLVSFSTAFDSTEKFFSFSNNRLSTNTASEEPFICDEQDGNVAVRELTPSARPSESSEPARLSTGLSPSVGRLSSCVGLLDGAEHPHLIFSEAQLALRGCMFHGPILRVIDRRLRDIYEGSKTTPIVALRTVEIVISFLHYIQKVAEYESQLLDLPSFWSAERSGTLRSSFLCTLKDILKSDNGATHRAIRRRCLSQMISIGALRETILKLKTKRERSE